MAFRLDDIGNRLRAYRMASGMSADEIAKRLGISRTALYRFESGGLAKIDTLAKLADLLEVSVPTLLGVGVEYAASAVAYFERTRQVEESAEHIIVLAGPISYLLASDRFAENLPIVLRESIPRDVEDRAKAMSDVDEIMSILWQRKATYRKRRPSVVNLIAAVEVDRFLRNGFVGTADLPPDVQQQRKELAYAEVTHFAETLQNQPIGVQIGIVPDTLPHSGFQIFRQPDRQVLTVSPFRLGEQPNIRFGVAMITSAPEALTLHQKMVEEMWRRSLKGAVAADYLRARLATFRERT